MLTEPGKASQVDSTVRVHALASLGLIVLIQMQAWTGRRPTEIKTMF